MHYFVITNTASSGIAHYKAKRLCGAKGGGEDREQKMEIWSCSYLLILRHQPNTKRPMKNTKHQIFQFAGWGQLRKVINSSAISNFPQYCLQFLHQRQNTANCQHCTNHPLGPTQKPSNKTNPNVLNHPWRPTQKLTTKCNFTPGTKDHTSPPPSILKINLKKIK